MFRRRQYDILMSRIQEPRATIQVVSGSRQVGKSTMVHQVLDDCPIPYYLENADHVEKTNRTWISEVWATARLRMQNFGYKEFLLVIDEIQKIDNWSEAVKREWDSDTFHNVNLKVVLLGSSRLLIKDGLTESLAGRFEIIRMPHWSYPEMKEAFGISLNEYVYFGGYPGGVRYVKDLRRWKRYVKDSIIAPAIDKDVIGTKVILKPELMRRLMELGCEYSGKELSLNKMLGQLQDSGNVTTLANYLTTLDESRLLCGLQKYSVDYARKYNSVPKLMVYNTALLSALSDDSYEDVFLSPKILGRWMESAVGAHLLNLADEFDYKVYYWRDGDDEVDFVVTDNRRCIAIEVKSGIEAYSKGLSVFRERFHPDYAFTIGPDGAMSIEEFLSTDLTSLMK